MISQMRRYPLLKTEEDAKLGRILSKQRYHQNQLQTQSGPLRSDTLSPRSPRSPNTSGEASKASNSPRQGSQSSPRDISSTADTSRSAPNGQPVTAWTSVQEEVSFNSRTSSAKSPHSGDDLVVQDVSPDDFETRSSTSLLDSESIYLPVDVTGTPSNRPMTAPAASTPGTTAFISALTSNNVRPSTGTVDPKESKYDSLERRVIRPINQGIAKGQVKSTFDFSPPQSSGTGPTTRVRRPTPPTAESQDYDTSIDTSNLSDQENMEKVPAQELSLIKDKIGARKAQKTSAPTIEERKAKLFNKKVEKSDSNKSNIPVPNNTLSQRSSSANKTVSDSKSVKGKLNLEKFEESGRIKTLTNTASSVRDSGFLSRPCSDAVLGDTTHDAVEQRAATAIQACWRGYLARERNGDVMSVRKEIRARRAEDHIVLLKAELERYKHQSLEERKLRALQMEAIKTLWQEVQSLQTWKSEVLSSQTFRSSQDSNNKHYLSVSGSQRSSSSTERSDTLERLSDSTLRSAFSPVDVERQKDLEKTCASLQSQVSQLKEALDTISSAVFHSACFTLTQGQETEESGSIHVTGNFEHELESLEMECSPCSGRWSSVPHSLSPYPSEEEESYFSQVPQIGVPTPPRALRLEHKGDNSVMLLWQTSKLTDDTGNRSILGYRVYVNDKCMALVSSSKTIALVKGLDTNTTYKFYVKALSGLGESYESNIIMAKLAKGGSEQRRVSESSDSDMPDDSDKDHDSTESHEKRRHRKRETRKTRKVKSPRSEKTKSHTPKDADSRNETKSASPAPSDRPRVARAASDAAAAILTTPKRHMHKRNRSGDYHKIVVSDGNIDSSQSSKRESEGNVQSSPSDIPLVSSSSSPSSVTNSPTKSFQHRHVVLSQAKSASSDGSSKPSPQSALTDSRDTTNMSGTFTVDQASSYLQSITASVVKETIATSKAKLRESQDKDDSVKTHRRKRSSDFKMSDLTDGKSEGKGDRRSVGSADADSVSELDGDSLAHRHSDRKDPEKRLSDGASDDSRDGKVKGHRRKRSKDLQTQVSEWRKEDEGSGKSEVATGVRDGDSSNQNRPIIDGRKRHSSGSRPSSPMLTEAGEKDVFEKRRTPMAETLEQRLLNLSSKSNSMGSLNNKSGSPNPDTVPRPRQLPDPNIVFEESSMRKRTASLGSEGDLPQSGKSDQKSFASKLLHKLQTFSKSQEKIREKSRRKSSGESSRDSKPPSDDEGRRPRRISDSDHEASSDTSSLPRKHGDSSSGSHSDDSRSTRPKRTHKRTPSDGKLMPPASPGLDGERPTHSPIIMEGAMIKKGSSNVRRHASFHGLLPSKQDKHGGQVTEDGDAQKNDHGGVAMPTD